MLFYYDIPKINAVLNDFYNATGVRIDLVDDTFIPVSSSKHEICDYCRQIQEDEQRRQACIDFDHFLLGKSAASGKSEQAVCPFGRINIVSPVFYNQRVMGYLFFGQIHEETMHTQSVARLAEIIMEHILTENLLRPDTGELLQKALDYIHANLEKDLSIQEIAEAVNFSKSALYTNFHNHFHCTVGEYINKKRIECSLSLLINTPLSIEEVSQKVGFASASYFTKLFKKQMGTTPLKYRKGKR